MSSPRGGISVTCCRLSLPPTIISETCPLPRTPVPRRPGCRSRFMGGGGGPPRCGMASSTLPLPPMDTPSPSLVLEAFLKGTASALHIPHLVHVIIRCTSTTNTATRGETYLQKTDKMFANSTVARDLLP